MHEVARGRTASHPQRMACGVRVDWRSSATQGKVRSMRAWRFATRNFAPRSSRRPADRAHDRAHGRGGGDHEHRLLHRPRARERRAGSGRHARRGPALERQRPAEPRRISPRPSGAACEPRSSLRFRRSSSRATRASSRASMPSATAYPLRGQVRLADAIGSAAAMPWPARRPRAASGSRTGSSRASAPTSAAASRSARANSSSTACSSTGPTSRSASIRLRRR